MLNIGNAPLTYKCGQSKPASSGKSGKTPRARKLNYYLIIILPYVKVTQPYVKLTQPYVKVTQPYVKVTQPYVKVTQPYVKVTHMLTGHSLC